MRYKVLVDVMPMEEILDPQGKVVGASLHKLGLTQVENVRIGKHIRLYVDAANEQEASAIVEEACKKLLANLVMERYEYRIEHVAQEQTS